MLLLLREMAVDGGGVPVRVVTDRVLDNPGFRVVSIGEDGMVVCRGAVPVLCITTTGVTDSPVFNNVRS
jgi:hypothetical protein